LFEITEDGEKQVLSRGGKGFKTGTLKCYKPKPYINLVYQDQRWMQLELKVLADVGLVLKCWKINIIVCSDIS
jgi:GTPase involved in cell partitioning and DNA repair